MWEPDGWGWRARIGVLTPHADIGPESEFRALAPDGVSIHAARVPLALAAGGLDANSFAIAQARAFAEEPAVDEAAALLGASPLSAIAYCFTNGSYVRGIEDDAALKARLEHATNGIPVVITATAAALALRAVGARRIALIDPPWFAAEVSALGADYYRACGFEVVYAAPAGLPSGQRLIHPGLLYEWVRANTPASAGAVFIGGNGFRAIGVIRALEEDLQRPVLTANQVAFWQALRLSSVRTPITNYGMLFSHELPES